jgi:lyso-ornithine lipid O-acyltransferase
MQRQLTLSTGSWRASAVLIGFALLTLPLMPVQALLLRTSLRGARAFPHWYHRQVCRLLGIRLHIEGAIERDKPVLVVANHSSWLDIPVLSAVAPVSFIAKKEVGGWPFVSQLARLQRSVFVDRTRRTAVAGTASQMAHRLSTGDALVLFAEGTSTDGNRVLPLRTSLFGAVMPGRNDELAPSRAVVQTCAVVYGQLHGLPIDRAGRSLVGWYGDMEMGRHAWELLKAGPLDVSIRIGAPVAFSAFAGRKELARHAEDQLRESVVRLLRNRPLDEPVTVTPPMPRLNAALPQQPQVSAKWT